MVGIKLSHYTIEAELGRGGMGIVYRAKDTKLDRTVALKLLPAAALASDDDRERFYREAKAAAQLHHPHIASIFEIDEAVPDGSSDDDVRPFIAMEFIDGETLASWISKGPLKIDDAIRISIQIAEALELAHSKDIVHRDIKSANVMLTERRDAKVLDFGLAKTAQSTMLTRMGSTLGTVAYMSPEQARGEEVDRRTDIWALGAVLYEMISGRHAFAGDYEQAVVYSILNQPPEPLTGVRTGVPMMLEWIANKCLEKNRDERYSTCGDLIVDLKKAAQIPTAPGAGSIVSGSAYSTVSPGLSSSSMSMPAQIVAPVSTASRLPKWLPWALLPVLAVAGWLAGAGIFFSSGEPGIPPLTQRLDLNLESAVVLYRPAISPDGKVLAYTASPAIQRLQDHLVLHDLSTGISHTVDTGLNRFNFGPVFSPDGAWISVFSGRSSQIVKLRPEGSSPITVAPASDGFFMVWTSDGGIIYAAGGEIKLAPENGSPPVTLIRPDSSLGEVYLMAPVRLDDKTILFTSIVSGEPRINWLNLADKKRGVVVDGAVPVKVLESGFLLFYRIPPGFNLSGAGRSGLEITAQRFNTKSRSLYGSPLTIQGVDDYMDVSPTGTLFSSPLSGNSSPLFELLWLDSSGNVTPLDIDAGAYDDLALSPDGMTLAIEKTDLSGNSTDIWVITVASGIPQRLTLTGDNHDPSWSPDGRFITFSSTRNQKNGIYQRAATGSGQAELLVETSYRVPVPEWTPDGKQIVFADNPNEGAPSLFVYDLATAATHPLALGTEASSARVSPNGKYVAYVAVGDEQAVRIISLDDNEQFELAADGAHYPRWNHDGTGIYFRNGGDFFFQPVQTDPIFRILGEARLIASPGGGFDHFPSPVDDKVLVVRSVNQGTESSQNFNVVINWVAELERLLPDNR
jgi:serine/threonine protein kinase/Tol biopolymer transport system component